MSTSQHIRPVTSLKNGYPIDWPTPVPGKPLLAQSRVTEDEKRALYLREITTRDLAASLGVHETYLSSLFPHKVPLKDRKKLLAARKDYKLTVAVEILKGIYTIKQAADLAFTSYNTMHRNLERAKEMYPDLVEGYNRILKAQRQFTAASAREARASIKAKKDAMIGDAL